MAISNVVNGGVYRVSDAMEQKYRIKLSYNIKVLGFRNGGVIFSILAPDTSIGNYICSIDEFKQYFDINPSQGVRPSSGIIPTSRIPDFSENSFKELL